MSPLPPNLQLLRSADLVRRSPALQRLAPPDRARLLGDLDRVLRVVAGAYGKAGDYTMETGDLVQSKFEAKASAEGAEVFKSMVDSVDFPAFVAGLIENVFQAVVNASIQQMRAFGEMLAAVAMSLDQFAQSNVSEGQARDYLVSRYPSALKIESDGDGPAKVAYRDGGEDLLDLKKELGLPDGTDISDAEGEIAAMQAARMQLAQSRQKTLATMVLLGINRIVITNGRINAKVVFDMRASDTASRTASAERDEMKSKQTSAGAVAFSPWGGGGVSTTSKHMTTVKSAVNEQSDAKTEVSAQLSGEVRLDFKSETFPLERLADSASIANINQVAQPGGAPPQPRNN